MNKQASLFDTIPNPSIKEKARYSWLLQELARHNYLYHTKDDAQISDEEYDALFKELKDFEEKFPSMIDKNSPSKKVGNTLLASLGQKEHKTRMYGLENVFDEGEFNAFVQRIKNQEPRAEISFFADLKLDGIACELVYKNKELVLALTRGDGIIGEDITHAARLISNIPQKLEAIEVPDDFEVRGEVLFFKEDFDALNKKQEELGQKTFKNARNAAAGTLRQLDLAKIASRPLRFLAYSTTLTGENSFKTQALSMNALRQLGFHSSPMFEICHSVEEAHDFYKRVEKRRETLPFEIDGLVYKIDDLELQNALGYTARAPRFAIAWKFKAQKAYTKLKAINIQIGRTGVLTPVADLEPVLLGGVTVSSASLHNEDEIKKLDVRIGDTVLVQRAGDVIPKILEVDFSKREDSSISYEFPHTCPSCDSPCFREEGDVAWYCLNLSCPQIRVRALQHFVGKSGLDMAGVGPKWIERLIESNKVKNFADLFKLETKDLLAFDNVKEKSAMNFMESIDLVKEKASLQNFISALGIRHVGEQTALTLAKEYKNIEKLIEIARNKQSELLNLQDIGNEVSQSLHAFFMNDENKALIEELISLGVNPVYEAGAKLSSALEGKKILFTGTLSRPRTVFEKMVEEHGGSNASSVSKNLDILVVGENAGSKLEKAQKLGIQIMREDEFLQNVGIEG